MAAASLAVMAGTPSVLKPAHAVQSAVQGDGSTSLEALGREVRADCVAAGDTPAACDCMIEGLVSRLDSDDARRFFLLTLDAPAGDLPILSLDEVDRFADRVETAMLDLAGQCAP